MTQIFFRTFLLGALMLSSCKNDDPPRYVWDIELHDATDTCNDPPVLYDGRSTFRYEIAFDQSDVTVYIDDQPFATGNISGCDILYESTIWGEERDGYAIRWQLSGEAVYRQGGTACELSNGTDWDGLETFTLVSSDHPDIPAGCTYSLQTTGSFVGKAE